MNQKKSKNSSPRIKIIQKIYNSLMNPGAEIEYSKKIYSYCIFLTHGRAWDPQGWFWKPSDDCSNRGRKLL